jgi:hypothetical protein
VKGDYSCMIHPKIKKAYPLGLCVSMLKTFYHYREQIKKADSVRQHCQPGIQHSANPGYLQPGSAVFNLVLHVALITE